jgi:hypothetical protein
MSPSLKGRHFPYPFVHWKPPLSGPKKAVSIKNLKIAEKIIGLAEAE